MGKLISLLLILALLLTSIENKAQDPCKVTYIANEGFLIESANHKILTDALFGNIKGNWCDQPDDSIAGGMLKGSPPFDNIDLLLISHKHTDHFNDQMVVSFLKNNRKTILVCPSQVDVLLQKNPGYKAVSDRIKSFKSDNSLDSSLSVGKINLRILKFDHGAYIEKDSVTGKSYNIHKDVENFGYVINTDGYSVFHSGDASYSDKAHFELYNFGNKELDVAFVDRTFLRKEGQELLNSLIRSKNIIFMHIEPAKAEYYKSIIKSIPEMMVFTQKLEEKSITK